ncbi:MAG: rod shape-determining protein RodA [Myxococcales bacterium]|jgi:rod shape determining protein RodA|nr:rod shape-determining protein RodA [Myxococcales bacterium]
MTSQKTKFQLIQHIPWHLMFVLLLIAGIGIWNLASAASSSSPDLWQRQGLWFLIGLASCVGIMLIDYRYFLSLAYPIYGFVVLLLVFVEVKGHNAMGAQRWIDLGPMHLQPSELMKIAIVLVLARFFHEDPHTDKGHSIFQLWQPGLLLLIPIVLVMKQPDLGTSALIAATAGSMILVAKVRWKSLCFMAVSGVALGIFAWFELLHDYQRKRVFTFLDPESDILGSGYHASQSLVALGSGQLWGKGWGRGTQTQLSFLPEQHTDFVFSVWGEEHGFVGALVLLVLYVLLIAMMLQVAATAREKFGSFLALGITAIIFWHMFINIGMVASVVPVVGVTLPFMSYGGSSMLTNMVGMGLLINVAMRRHLF